MTSCPATHALGRIDVVELDEAPALSRDVSLDLAQIQGAWPDFEGSFESLQGRRMMGLFYAGAGIYRMSASLLESDAGHRLGHDETVRPGGRYLRLRLRGAAPGVYDQIAPAFDVLFDLADHDPTRPHIEYYRCEGEVDCLVPVVGATPGRIRPGS